MLNYNTPIAVVSRAGDDDVRVELKAVVDPNMFFLPVDADIEEGDTVQHQLPNGKIRTVRITKVDVLQSPFGGASALDHTEAHYTTALSAKPSGRGAGDTFHVHATNVQVATGDGAHQTMTVGQTADQLELVMAGIGQILEALGLVQGREAEFTALKQEAVDGITADRPTADPVRRFYEWVTQCVKAGGSAAVVAAVTAASNGVLHDAEELVRAVHG